MSRHNVNRKVGTKNRIVDDGPWGVMLRDVLAEIKRLNQRLADLKQSAGIIEEKIRRGEPFPEGEFASTQN